MRAGLLAVVVVGCGGGSSAPPAPEQRSSVERPTELMVLGSPRMRQGEMKGLAFRGSELWAVSWDGVLSSSGPADPKGGESGLWIWDPAKRRVIRRAERRITQFALARDAVAAIDEPAGDVMVLDPATLAPRWSLALGDPSGIAITPDGKTVLAGDRRGGLHSIVDGRVVWETTEHREYTDPIAVSPDGKYVASGGGDVDVVIRETATHDKVATVHHDAPPADSDTPIGVLAVAFSPDGKQLATGGWDRTVRTFDVPSGKPRLVIREDQDVFAVAWSPDGSWLASGGRGNRVRLWHASDGTAGANIEAHGNFVGAVAFGPDGKTLASGGWDNMIKLWNVATGVESGAAGHSDALRSIDETADGKKLISIGADRKVSAWDIATGRELTSFTQTYFETDYAVSPDGTLLAYPGDDVGTEVVRVADGKAVVTLPGLRAAKLAFEGTRIAIAADDELTAFDVPSGKRAWTTKLDGQTLQRVGRCDGALWFLVAAGVTIVDAATGKTRATLAAPDPAFENAVLSPDCAVALTAVWMRADDGFTAREIATGRVRYHVPGYEHPVFSRDGKWIAATTEAGKIGLIDAATGKVVQDYPGHDGHVTALAVLVDGRVASGGDDAVVKIWPR